MSQLTTQQRLAQLKAKAKAQSTQPPKASMKQRTVLMTYRNKTGDSSVMYDSHQDIIDVEDWLYNLIYQHEITRPGWYYAMTFGDDLTITYAAQFEIVMESGNLQVHNRQPGKSTPTNVNLTTWPPKVKS